MKPKPTTCPDLVKMCSRCVCGEETAKCTLGSGKDCVCGSRPCEGDAKKKKGYSRIPVRQPKLDVCKKCVCNPKSCNMDCMEAKTKMNEKPKKSCKCSCKKSNCALDCERINQENCKLLEDGKLPEVPKKVCQVCKCYSGICNPECLAHKQEMANQNRYIKEGKRRNATKKSGKKVTKCLLGEVCPKCDCQPGLCSAACIQKKETDVEVEVEKKPDDVCEDLKNKAEQSKEDKIGPSEKKSLPQAKVDQQGEPNPVCENCECDEGECNSLCLDAKKAGGEAPKDTPPNEACDLCVCDPNECNPVCMEAKKAAGRKPDEACDKCDCEPNECNPVCLEKNLVVVVGNVACVEFKNAPSQDGNVVCAECFRGLNECKIGCEKPLENEEEVKEGKQEPPMQPTCDVCDCADGECDPTCLKFRQKPTKNDSHIVKVNIECDCKPSCNAAFQGECQATQVDKIESPKSTQAVPESSKSTQPAKADKEACTRETCFLSKPGKCGICVQTDDQAKQLVEQDVGSPGCTIDTCLPSTTGVQTDEEATKAKECNKDFTVYCLSVLPDKNICGQALIKPKTCNSGKLNKTTNTTPSSKDVWSNCQCSPETCKDSCTSKGVNVPSTTCTNCGAIAGSKNTPKARSTTNANCNCGDQGKNRYVQELEAIMMKIKCTCQKAEQLQNPYVPTPSDLQLVVDMYHKKCKAKDAYIDALVKDLNQRGQSHVFDNLLGDIANTNAIIPDFDATEISKALSRKNKPPFDRSQSCPCERKINVDDLKIIEVRRIAMTSLVVKWTPVKDKNVTGYEVYVDGRVKGRVLCRLRTTTLVESLDLKVPLKIEVFALSNNGKCGSPAIANYTPLAKSECNCN